MSALNTPKMQRAMSMQLLTPVKEWRQNFQLRPSHSLIPFNSSNKLHSPGSPLFLWASFFFYCLLSHSMGATPASHFRGSSTEFGLQWKNPSATFAIWLWVAQLHSCDQNSSQHLQFIRHTKARRYRHPQPTSKVSCTTITICSCFNTFGDTVVISSQVPRTTAICCVWPWAYWLLWYSSHRLP